MTFRARPRLHAQLDVGDGAWWERRSNHLDALARSGDDVEAQIAHCELGIDRLGAQTLYPHPSVPRTPRGNLFLLVDHGGAAASTPRACQPGRARLTTRLPRPSTRALAARAKFMTPSDAQ